LAQQQPARRVSTQGKSRALGEPTRDHTCHGILRASRDKNDDTLNTQDVGIKM